jgi:hypothetical protein
MNQDQKETKDLEILHWSNLVKAKLTSSAYPAVAALIEIKPDGSKLATIINPYETNIAQQLEALQIYIQNKQVLAVVFYNRQENQFWGKLGLTDQLHLL